VKITVRGESRQSLGSAFGVNVGYASARFVIALSRTATQGYLRETTPRDGSRNRPAGSRSKTAAGLATACGDHRASPPGSGPALRRAAGRPRLRLSDAAARLAGYGKTTALADTRDK